jgi:hypothetical protein
MSALNRSIATIFTLVILPGKAWAADSGSIEIKMIGEAKSVCALPAQPQAATMNARFADKVITIDKLLDDTKATAKAATVNLTFPGVMCNYGAMVTLATYSGGLVSDGTTTDLTGGTFLKRIDYKIQGNWGTVPLNPLTTTGIAEATAVTNINGANIGDLRLTIGTEDGNAPVVEGEFSDTIALKVGAAY